MKQKGICPFDYVYSFNKFKDKKLRSKEDFYRILNDEHEDNTQVIRTCTKCLENFEYENNG